MLTLEHKSKIINIRDDLSSLFKDLGDTPCTGNIYDDKDLDDIMQRIEQMKIEINDLINDYNIKEEN
jgi:hypothetical protein|tara:strand:- start:213 stop:413 length:201 start_codon:yes stop_codon:yes gene_type:complete